jgi:hypothetical protein
MDERELQLKQRNVWCTAKKIRKLKLKEQMKGFFIWKKNQPILNHACSHGQMCWFHAGELTEKIMRLLLRIVVIAAMIHRW